MNDSPARARFVMCALATALMLSGCAALVYQVVWFRMLSRAFGATAPAVATVLAVFMAGLGLGAALVGRSADARTARSCLARYALLELGIGAFALLTPWLLGALPAVYAHASAHFGFDALARNSTRTLAAACVLLPPTLLMGATLPLMLSGLRPGPGGVSRAVGALYAANNVGAVLGTLVSGFALLRAFGETRSIAVAAVLNVTAAGLALLGRSRTAASVERSAPPTSVPEAAARLPIALLCGAAGSGLLILGFEVIWSRTIAPLVGSTVYAFSAILAAVLIGLALGSAAAARWGDRVTAPQYAFAGLGALAAVTALATMRLAPALVSPAMALLGASEHAAWRLAGVPFVLSTALVLVPSALSGAALPLAIRALAGRQGAAASTGLVYAANTAGSIAGALLTGLLLIPAVGTNRASAIVAIGGGLLCAIAGVAAAPRRASPVVWLPVAALLVLAVTQPPTNILLFSGGLHMMTGASRALVAKHGIETRLAGSEVLYLAEGESTTVLVERRWGRRAFYVDGKPEATDGVMDMRNQYLLAHIPALLHGRVERALVVGLGSGMTAGCLTLHGDVHVAELSAIVPQAAHTFADLNHDVVGKGKARIFIEDGRTFLQTRPNTYDVITVDPIHPYVAGASTLYTRDYFAAVRRRLRPGGIASHWLPLYQLGWSDVAGVLKSFQDVFPDATVYATDRDAILVGNAGARLPTASRVASGFASRAVREDLARVLIDSPEQLVALATLGPRGIRALTRDARAITDDHMWIEFTAPRWFQNPTLDNLRRIAARREPARHDATGAERAARDTYTAVLADVVAGSRQEALAALHAAVRRGASSRELALRLRERGGGPGAR